MTRDVTLWSPRSAAVVPKAATTAADISVHAQQLTRRERDQIFKAFGAGDFELGTAYLWSRAMATLKRQLALFGTEFIGEMLDREDLPPGVALAQVITDHEAVRLAEELGMFNGTQAFRLKRALDTVSHFADPTGDEFESPDGGGREMMPEEATQIARACVEAILGQEKLEGAVEFADFRNALESRTLSVDDEEVQKLLASPYFFQRTTVRALVAQIKTREGAALDHVMENLEMLVPHLWNQLAKPEKYILGRAYAEVHADGKKSAAASIRRALLQVHGFDFVPEDLRSRTFIAAAKRVKDAHFGIDNFLREPAPMGTLVRLGTVIPMPALGECVSAALCVYLGRPWGYSWDAEPLAKSLLVQLKDERWRYYLDDCLPLDDDVLGKLDNETCGGRWVKLVTELDLGKLVLAHKRSLSMLEAAVVGNVGQLTKLAEITRDEARSGRSA
jgi:hypothetical protein